MNWKIYFDKINEKCKACIDFKNILNDMIYDYICIIYEKYEHHNIINGKYPSISKDIKIYEDIIKNIFYDIINNKYESTNYKLFYLDDLSEISKNILENIFNLILDNYNIHDQNIDINNNKTILLRILYIKIHEIWQTCIMNNKYYNLTQRSEIIEKYNDLFKENYDFTGDNKIFFNNNTILNTPNFRYIIVNLYNNANKTNTLFIKIKDYIEKYYDELFSIK
jgi:hypothetical protein